MPAAMIAETASEASSIGVEEPDRDRGDDTEGAFGAHGDADEVVARVLGRLAAKTHEHPRAGHQLEPEDMVRGDAVLEAVRPAGVGRDVSPDGRDHLARRVWREEISMTRD